MNRSALHHIATLGPWLAPAPSAFFIGRSIYLHLLAGWAGGAVPVAVNLSVAIVAGLVVELLAIVSVHNALALARWNNSPRVNRDKGAWERAPMGIALFCVSLYVATAVLLLVILEAAPVLALYAPILFPLLAVVGALNLAILDQHTARIARYGLAWDFSKRPQATCKRPASGSERPRAKPRATVSDTQATASDRERLASGLQATESETVSDRKRIDCDLCDWQATASDYESDEAWRNAGNAHRGWHTRREREAPE